MQRNLPARKHPRMKTHDYSRIGSYFITICAKDGHEMLGRVVSVGRDAHIAPHVQLTEYGIIADKYIKRINAPRRGLHLDNYVVMPNHLHMIIVVKSTENNAEVPCQNGAMWTSRPTNAVIPRIVRSYKTMVTKEIGFSLWQASYYDHIIRNESEHRHISHYIDENPIKWHEDRYYVREQGS